MTRRRLFSFHVFSCREDGPRGRLGVLPPGSSERAPGKPHGRPRPTQAQSEAQARASDHEDHQRARRSPGGAPPSGPLAKGNATSLYSSWTKRHARDPPRRQLRPHQVLARPGKRPRPVRPLPEVLQAPGRPARPLLRPRPRARPDRPHHLRPLLRLLRRPHREKTPQPLPPRHPSPLLRHRRLQPGLQVLPELGHQQIARESTPSPTRPAPRRSPPPPAASAAAASPSPTTTPSSSTSTPSTSPLPAARRGSPPSR